MQPTPVFLPAESQGRKPGGLPSMGSHRVGHDWRDLAAAAFLIYIYKSFIVLFVLNSLSFAEKTLINTNPMEKLLLGIIQIQRQGY